MKCPVCGNAITRSSTKCIQCGFDNLKFEFINRDDYRYWLTNTVNPCRCVYVQMLQKQIDFFSFEENYKPSPCRKMKRKAILNMTVYLEVVVSDLSDRIDALYQQHGITIDEEKKD